MGAAKPKSKHVPKNRKLSGKSRAANRPKLISFNEESRMDFITGFRTRRLQRQAEAKKALEQTAKADRVRKRKDAKQARDEYFEQLHPSMYKDHKLIDSLDEQENETEPQEIVQEFSDDEHNIVVVKTSNDIVLDVDLHDAINQCDVPPEHVLENTQECPIRLPKSNRLKNIKNRKQLKKSFNRSRSK